MPKRSIGSIALLVACCSVHQPACLLLYALALVCFCVSHPGAAPQLHPGWRDLGLEQEEVRVRAGGERRGVRDGAYSEST